MKQVCTWSSVAAAAAPLIPILTTVRLGAPVSGGVRVCEVVAGSSPRTS